MVRTAAGLRNKDLPERFLRHIAQSDVRIFIFLALAANKELTR
jgi:hypothetical protein